MQRKSARLCHDFCEQKYAPQDGCSCTLALYSTMNNRALIENVVEGKNDSLFSYLQSGGDANLMDKEWNCPILFHAVLGGNLNAVQKLIESGANVNLIAEELGCDRLAETVLSLTMQCRHLQNFKKIDPIVRLLEQHGAKDEI